ncbi:MAG: PAS domain S-box protein [Candidatus Aminicenantes bacterium]|nr:PAS domain S-box protein [Candidatus Aminicenantes bacterium]
MAHFLLEYYLKIDYLMSKKNHNNPHGNLTVQNTLLNIALFISPVLLIFLFINRTTSGQLKDQIYGKLSASVEENVKTIGIFIKEREFDLRSLSRLDIEEVSQISRYKNFFTTFVREKEWYEVLLAADKKGDIVLSTSGNITGNIADRQYFQVSIKGEPFNSGIFHSDILKIPVMILSRPLLNRKNEQIGVLALSLKLQNLYSLIFDLRLGETSELFLVDEEGFLLSPTKLGGKPLVDKGYSGDIPNPHTGERDITTHLDYRGVKVLCAYEKIPNTQMVLVSEMDLEEAMLPVKNFNRIVLLVFTPFFILLVFISNLQSRRITTLLQRLTKKLQDALAESRKKRKELDIINVEFEKKIEESERLTLELRLSEEYIRQLIDSISIGVIGLDRYGKITHFNKKSKQLLPDYLDMGKKIFSLLPWPDDPELLTSFEEALNSRTPVRSKEKEWEREGREEYYLLSFFPIEKENGKVSGVTLVIENITYRKKLREQLAEYEKLSALSQLALGAAHEINNPLQGISSYLEILADQTDKSKEKEEIQFVLENVYRISETIRGLLNFARPTPPQFTKVNINHLIADTLSFLGHQPIFRKIKIKKNLPQSLPQITADLSQIRQVLINLFINAAQSMPEGGELKTETSKVKFKEIIRIDITDTGCGIPPDKVNKIFNPFFTTKKSQGTGLGLSISLSYIKNHKGDIQVKSKVDEGTTISLFLPIRQKGKVLPKDEETIT